jgi:hypothetical protein
MADWITEYQKFKQTPWEPTKLKTSEEEKQFRQWLQNTQIFQATKKDIAAETKIPVDKLDNNRILEMMLKQSDYDYRGAWKDNMKESIDPTDNRPHMLSSTSSGRMLKDPTHPTAWKEFFMRQYRIDPDKLGLDDYSKAVDWSQASKVVNPFYTDPMGFTIK